MKVSAPLRMNIDTIRVFIINKLNWIKKQQARFKNQERETPREYLTKETHYFFGQRYLLNVIEQDAPAKVILTHSSIELYIKSGAGKEKRKQILDEWYRTELKNIIPKMLEEWENKIGVKANEFGIKKMRTKWGTCNITAKRIWFNLELAKKPIKCLEYIIVHELIHLLERKHNDRFVKFMNSFLPKWKFCRNELNRLPFRYTEWKY